MTTYRRIHSKGEWRHEEYVAHAILSPGNILEMNSDNEVLKHATENGSLTSGKLIAQEDALQGRVASTAYAAADIISVAVAESGSEWNLLVESGQVLTIGEELIANGLGALKSAGDVDSGETANVIAVCLEAVTTTAIQLVNVRIL